MNVTMLHVIKMQHVQIRLEVMNAHVMLNSLGMARCVMKAALSPHANQTHIA
jgi:hypothetical protein